jgi:hypothetical protein
MVFAGVSYMTIALEALLVAHMFYYTVLFYIMSRSALYIPIAIARGFTAHFGKEKPGQIHPSYQGFLINRVIGIEVQ